LLKAEKGFVFGIESKATDFKSTGAGGFVLRPVYAAVRFSAGLFLLLIASPLV
jgi:hypothetical protein